MAESPEVGKARSPDRWGAVLLTVAWALLLGFDGSSAAVAGSSSVRDGGEVAKFRFEFDPLDAGLAPELEAVLAAGRTTVEEFFGSPFLEPVSVEIYPTRAAFTASFPPEWGMTETACWMVASGVADRLIVLSPRVWEKEACEHDPGDARHVRDILVHELAHVYHGQHNPTRDFTGADEVGWFAEGLAVHVSGQLEHGRLADPREAVERGVAPDRLEHAWSGKYRYGVCGSLVAYLDATLGRDAIRKLLAVTTQEQLLTIVGTSEGQLLEDWKRWMLGRSPG